MGNDCVTGIITNSTSEQGLPLICHCKGPLLDACLWNKKIVSQTKTFYIELILWNGQAILSCKLAQDGADAEFQHLKMLTG